MAQVILMPELTDVIPPPDDSPPQLIKQTGGTILIWHKKIGDRVEKGDLLIDVETDHAVYELECDREGTLLYIAGEKGTRVNANSLLAVIGTQGEDISHYIQEP